MNYAEITLAPDHPDRMFIESQPFMLNVEEYAQIMGISVPLVRKQLRNKKIPHKKVGARVVIPRTFLLAQVAEAYTA